MSLILLFCNVLVEVRVLVAQKLPFHESEMRMGCIFIAALFRILLHNIGFVGEQEEDSA